MKAEPSHDADILSPRGIEILRRACKNSKTRAKFLQNPRAFLARNGVELPDNVEVRIYKRKTDPSRTPERDVPEVVKPLPGSNSPTRSLEPRPVSPAFDAWWRSTHGGCPPGTVPYTTTEKRHVCLMWAVFCLGQEWVSDQEDPRRGHFECSKAESHCVWELNINVAVEACFPPYLAPDS